MIEQILSKLKSDLYSHKIDTQDYISMGKDLTEYCNNNFNKHIKFKINTRLVKLDNIRQGKYESKNLITIHELCLFALYELNRNRYKYFFDLGANIGVHTLIANANNFIVNSYEPDPQTFKLLRNNILNSKNINIYNRAIASTDGIRRFTRVNDNLTASGFTDNKEFYGDVSTFIVHCERFNNLKIDNSIVKIDIEGCELEIFECLSKLDIRNTLFLIEITNQKSALFLWDIRKKLNNRIFSQKIGWNEIMRFKDLPTNWREGSVAIADKIV